MRYVQRALLAPDALVLSGPVIGGNPAIFALLNSVGPSSALERCVYPGAMHEIFNETNSDEVIADVVRFLKAQLRLE